MSNLCKIIPINLAILLISGCTSLNSNFDCPMKPGVRCESLDQINERVDRGEIAKPSSRPAFDSVEDGHISPLPNCCYVKNKYPVRFYETTMKVWVAPYEDIDGNYHQDSNIYTVIKPGHWMGNPSLEKDIDEV